MLNVFSLLFQIDEELALIAANGTAQSAALAAAASNPASESYKRHGHNTSNNNNKRVRRESHVSPDALLTWFQKQLASVDCVSVNDMTYSFQDGLALCAVITRFRPELIDFQVKTNINKTFDSPEHESTFKHV